MRLEAAYNGFKQASTRNEKGYQVQLPDILDFTGAPGKIRTCDLRIRSPFTKLTSRKNTRQEYLIIKGY